MLCHQEEEREVLSNFGLLIIVGKSLLFFIFLTRARSEKFYNFRLASYVGHLELIKLNELQFTLDDSNSEV